MTLYYLAFIAILTAKPSLTIPKSFSFVVGLLRQLKIDFMERISMKKTFRLHFVKTECYYADVEAVFKSSEYVLKEIK